MNNQFLAEHFRAIMDQLDNIIEADPTASVEDSEQKDIEDLLKTDRPQGIQKNQIENLLDLIDFIDQYSELDEWRNHEAAYDDAFYENLPLDVLQNVTDLSPNEIEEIASRTDEHEGDYIILNSKLTIFGAI